MEYEERRQVSKQRCGNCKFAAFGTSGDPLADRWIICQYPAEAPKHWPYAFRINRVAVVASEGKDCPCWKPKEKKK